MEGFISVMTSLKAVRLIHIPAHVVFKNFNSSGEVKFLHHPSLHAHFQEVKNMLNGFLYT